MKVAVLGGSFDPVHRGHEALLRAAVRAVRPDRILLVPTFRSPLKGSARESAATRLRLLKAFQGSLPAGLRRLCRIDPGEALSGRPVYTIETLGRLNREHPGAELHVIVGSDAAASFARWRSPDRLRRSGFWWSARRPGARVPKGFRPLPGRMPEISSTEIREALALGQDVSGLLAPAVRRAIERESLYGGALLRRLKKDLSAERFEHSLAVAELAAALARRWGADPEKARLAGLLHDCGRAVPVPAMASYARRRRIAVPLLGEVARRQPLLAHAYISERLARERYGARDAGVLSAIRKHTLGAASMSPLDRILYVSDSSSRDRAHPEAARIRALAFRDLDEAFKAGVLAKLRHALSREGWIHPMTVALWNRLA